MVNIVRNIILSLLFVSGSVFAKEVRLFETSGKPVSEYQDSIVSLKENDVVIFSDGKKIKIKSVLGEGGMTRVFETSNGEAIRILKNTGFSDDYVESIRVLLARGVPAPLIIEKYKAEYTLMQKIDVQFTMADLLVDGQGLSPLQQKTLFAALQTFAERSARYLYVGDFRPDQIAFDGSRWILLDATNIHIVADNKKELADKGFGDQNIFRQFDENFIDQIFGKGKRQLLESTIAARRMLLTKNKCAFVHL